MFKTQLNSNPKTPDISIVVLCYKAGDSTRQVIKKIIDILEENKILNYELVLVGNYLEGSTDITPKVVAELSAANSKIIHIAKPKQGMMGWDMRSGLDLASGEYVAVIDGDGQMPFEDLIKVYYKIKNNDLDLVKTYRLVRGDSPWRKLISLIYNLIFHFFFPGLKSKDINAKPKIFSRSALNKLNLISGDWFIDAEIMIQARRHNFKIGQVETFFRGLEGRKSFIRPEAILEFLKNLIIFRIREFKYSKK